MLGLPVVVGTIALCWHYFAMKRKAKLGAKVLQKRNDQDFEAQRTAGAQFAAQAAMLAGMEEAIELTDMQHEEQVLEEKSQIMRKWAPWKV